MAFRLLEEQAPEEQSESFLESTGRQIARSASRVGEQIAGAPGDIFSMINEYIAKPITEFATGKPGVSYEETPLGKILPTTETHRKAMEKKFGKTIQPQNKYEKFLDQVLELATAIGTPGIKAGQVGKTAFSSLGKSIGANLIGTGIQDITADETKSTLGKFGSLFLFSLIDKPRAAASVGELYKPLAEKVTKLKPVNATGLEAELNNLKGKMTKGTIAPSEKFVIDEVDAILPKIVNGKITPEEAWASKRSLNEKLSKALFDIPKKADQARARKLATEIGHSLDNALKETEKQDPKFYKDLKAVNKAFGVISKSNLISNFIENNLKYSPLTSGLMHAFQGSVGSGIATAALPYEVGKVLYRISHSPILAKHYAKTLAAAAKEDSIVMNRELKKLDQAMQKEQTKERYRFID